ncbi:conserved hypothetical protein (plasmid) [Aeromonas salmonicida subsp. salmonicida A449]|uniref:Permease n=3 Tax=Aeromonas TaxID=642 RepID=A0A189PGZ7_AERSS|nr:conserved hypothetical protein [Aeromonas salmonicida subsp. salmonicida A449]ALL42290.1 hypothetical protein [Aeromonas salmonicida subsp. salmonicida]ALL42447.1 hypothetical protein [Aeromonas salmonicida subsp. salmonicida]ASI25752.1 hypothetical protein CE463_01080 [Aeromonas salmonicida]
MRTCLYHGCILCDCGKIEIDGSKRESVMRNVVNILLLASVLLGIPMMADTPWGLVFVLGPLMVWSANFFVLVNKSLWASLVLLGGVAYFQWQLALGMLILVAIVRALIKARREGVDLRGSKSKTIDGVNGPLSIDLVEKARWGE